MKKLVISISLLFLVVQVHSQTLQSVEIGPKAGINISSWGGDDFDTKSRTSANVGGFAILKFSDQFGLQPEVLYSSQGAQSDDGDIKIPANYLSIPILAHIAVNEYLYVNAGPQISFLLSAKDGDDDNAKDEFNSSDFSFGIGGGYGFPSVPVHIQVRYNIGLSNINSSDFEENTKGNVFQISLGYILWRQN